jgi:bacteriorhodopsin
MKKLAIYFIKYGFLAVGVGNFLIALVYSALLFLPDVYKHGQEVELCIVILNVVLGMFYLYLWKRGKGKESRLIEILEGE